MRELENKKALSEEEEEKVAGGRNNTLLENPSMDPVIEGQNIFGRPLPFPQDRRGNKAPLEMNANPFAPIHRIQGLPDDPLDTNPFDFPFC